MRFRVIDKILLVLLLLATVAASALLFLMAIEAVGGEGAVYYIELLTNGHIVNRLILGGGGLLLLVIALRLFIALCSRPEKATETARQQQPTSTLVLSGDNGSAYITLAAIDSLVQRNVRKNPLVRECESLVTVPGDGTTSGVKIALRLSCAPEAVIPELSGELQMSLKAELEAMTGVGVTGVDVLILPPPVNKAPKTL